MKLTRFLTAIALIVSAAVGTGCYVRAVPDHDDYCRHHDCRDHDWHDHDWR